MKANIMNNSKRIVPKGKCRWVVSILWGSVFFCFLLSHILCSEAWADDSVRGRRVPRIDIDDPLYRDYPTRFDGMGFIDLINTDRILIDDTPYRFSANVTFHTPRRRRASAGSFRQGQYVGYLQDSSGAIKDIYLLKRKE